MSMYKYAIEANELGMWQCTILDLDTATSMHETKEAAIAKVKALGETYVVIDEHVSRADQDRLWYRIDFALKKETGPYPTQQAAVAAGKALGHTMIVFNSDGSIRLELP